ncbi:MAG: DUF1573 domain-containing protein, partial [Planctomycetota bacterium]|nr:DUF1573 domain-containing protein [Planctomycetota bacterium]
LALVVGLVGCGEDETTPLLSGARVQDFGIVAYTRSGMAIEHTFTLTNISGRPLKIEKISTSCGCVTPTVNSMTLEPDAELRLETSMVLMQSGQKHEHINIIFKGNHDPIKLDLFAYGCVVLELTAKEGSITVSDTEPGILTLRARTPLPDIQPLDPFWEDRLDLGFDFGGWERFDEGDESSSWWRGVLRITLITSTNTERVGETVDTFVVRIDEQNELRVPMKVIR